MGLALYQRVLCHDRRRRGVCFVALDVMRALDRTPLDIGVMVSERARARSVPEHRVRHPNAEGKRVCAGQVCHGAFTLFAPALINTACVVRALSLCSPLPEEQSSMGCPTNPSTTFVSPAPASMRIVVVNRVHVGPIIYRAMIRPVPTREECHGKCQQRTATTLKYRPTKTLCVDLLKIDSNAAAHVT